MLAKNQNPSLVGKIREITKEGKIDTTDKNGIRSFIHISVQMYQVLGNCSTFPFKRLGISNSMATHIHAGWLRETQGALGSLR